MTQHETLAAALAAMQAELPKLRKTEKAKVNGESKTGAKISYSYGYTGLDQVVETVLPALGKNGLSVTSKTSFADGLFMLEVALLHEGGEREIGYWPLPDPRRVGPQDIGSAMTYGRRYLTLSLTGTFPGGEDDDGAKAQETPRESWDNAKPVKPQNAPVPAPPAVQKMAWTDAEVAELHEKLADLTSELAKVGKGYDWMAAKGLHERGIGESGLTATLILALRLADQALLPETTLDEIVDIREFATGRGLLKVKVSPTETLEQALYEAQELVTHAAAAEASQDTPQPEDLK